MKTVNARVLMLFKLLSPLWEDTIPLPGFILKVLQAFLWLTRGCREE
jgi:hypothetical protein